MVQLFHYTVGCSHRQGLTPLQKCTMAIRQLANGSAADHLDEHLKISASTGLEANEDVCRRCYCSFW